LTSSNLFVNTSRNVFKAEIYLKGKMEHYFIKKEDFSKFTSSLVKKKYEVIAPLEIPRPDLGFNITTFSVLKEGDEVSHNHPRYPAKSFFLPQKEDLFEFENGKFNETMPKKKRVVFLHRCDANALLIVDKMYAEGKYPDPYYTNLRNNTVLIDIPCIPTKHCFCTSMDLVDFFDLRFLKHKNGFFVEIGSKKGESLITPLFRKTNDDVKYKEPDCRKKLLHGKAKCAIYARDYPEMWQEYQEKCLSCSACTASCPTCSCFDVIDTVNFKATKGKRQRAWASCQGLDFTKVAGGYVFRKDRDKRVKQRIFCKLKYMYDIFGRARCVGCGRCVINCPTDIDIVKIANKLKCK